MTHFNKKVADARGDKWLKNLSLGRMRAELDPSTLRLLRMKLGITQSTLAKALRVTLPTYCSIENGKRAFKEETRAAIIDFLKIKPNQEKLYFKKLNEKKFLTIKKVLAKSDKVK